MQAETKTYRVYYDTPNGRPSKMFDQRHEAIGWARAHADRAPIVVEEVTVWTRAQGFRE